MTTLAWNRYGKARVRLVKVRREHDPHELIDVTLDVQLEGAFEPVYVDGDNRSCVATDTMKNTVYAFARTDDIAHIELFAERLAAHFAKQPSVTRVRISATEHPWQRVSVGGHPHPHAFVQPGGEQWTACVTCDGRRDARFVRRHESGVAENHRLRVYRFCPRSIHDAVGHDRPHPRNRSDRVMAISNGDA